jgi:hypothetical protein
MDGFKNFGRGLPKPSRIHVIRNQFQDAKPQKKEPTAKSNAQSSPSKESTSAEPMAAQPDQGCSQIKEERNRLPASPWMGRRH